MYPSGSQDSKKDSQGEIDNYKGEKQFIAKLEYKNKRSVMRCK